MPAQDRVWGDQAMATQRSRQPLGECGEHGRSAQSGRGLGSRDGARRPRAAGRAARAGAAWTSSPRSQMSTFAAPSNRATGRQPRSAGVVRTIESGGGLGGILDRFEPARRPRLGALVLGQDRLAQPAVRRQVLDTRLWVPRTGSCHATAGTRGRGRRAGLGGAPGWLARGGGVLAVGGRCSSDRCGRWVLKCCTYSRSTTSRWRRPVIRMWSRHSRRSVPMNRSAIAFARGAWTGVRMIRMSAPVNTASNGGVNLLSRSRIRNRNLSARKLRSMSRLRACWVTQSPVEGHIERSCWSRRRP